MKCKKCGKENLEEARFCAACGSALNAEGASPEVPKAESTSHRGRTVAIAALAAALAVGGGGAGYYLGVYRPEQDRIAQEQALKTEKCGVRVAVSAAGWDTSAGGSRLALHVQGEPLAGKRIDRVMYVDSAGKGIELPRGSYEISAVGSPIAADGTIYSLPETIAKVKISEKTKKGATVVASSKYKFELTPVEALDVTDDMLAAARKYAEEDEGAKKDGYSYDVEALVAAATKRRDDAVSAKRDADEVAAKAEEERKAAEAAAQEHAAEDAFVATARKGLGIPDDLEGVTYKLLGSSYWEGAAMEVYAIQFYNSEGKVIAEADCTKDGMPATSIHGYSPDGSY